MGKVITFINEKGGIGKSTICMNIAWCFAKEHSKKILMVDLDGQNANLTYFCGLQKTDDMLTMYSILAENADVQDAVMSVNDAAPSLHIIPANGYVANLTPENASVLRMKETISFLSGFCDFVFLDVSPSPNWSHALALSASDFVIAPMLPDFATMEANHGLIESIQEVQKTANPALKFLGIVMNRYDWRPFLSRSVLNAASALAGELSSKVFDAKIHSSVAMSEYVGAHIGITDYKPKSKPAEDIRQLCAEIEQEVRKYG